MHNTDKRRLLRRIHSLSIDLNERKVDERLEEIAGLAAEATQARKHRGGQDRKHRGGQDRAEL